MDLEIKIALIGVMGTLLGTLVGWMLNGLSQKGTLNTYVSSFKEDFRHIDEMGCMAESKSIDQAETYSYSLILDLYNSSDKTKIARNITIIFSDGKHDLYKSIPYDDETKKRSGPLCFYDTITPINVPPKTIIELNLHSGISLNKNESDFIWRTQKIYLTYINEKNKMKKVQIKKEQYCNYFKNRKPER